MSMSKNMLLDRIGVALAGRAVEALIFEDVTTGAQNDFEQATNIAKRMVTSWGMSPQLGRVALASGNESYLGDYEGGRSYSEATAKLVDSEVKAIIETQYKRVMALIETHRELLEQIVEVLLERETLHADEFATIMRGEPLPALAPLQETPVVTTPNRNRDKEPRLPPTMMPKPG